jgi:hypothetical protein
MTSTVHVIRHGEVENPQKILSAVNQVGDYQSAVKRWRAL